MKTGEFYTLKEPDEHYYGYEMGVEYECVDGENAVLVAPNRNGWYSYQYGSGRKYLYVASHKFRIVKAIFIGGE